MGCEFLFFNELSPEVQAEVIERNRKLLVDNTRWDREILKYCADELQLFSLYDIQIHKQTNFDGDHCILTFSGQLNAEQFIERCVTDARVNRLADRLHTNIGMRIIFDYSLVTIQLDMILQPNHSHVTCLLEALEPMAEALARDFTDRINEMYAEEYELLTSDEEIVKELRNAYEFKQDGAIIGFCEE